VPSAGSVGYLSHTADISLILIGVEPTVLDGPICSTELASSVVSRVANLINRANLAAAVGALGSDLPSSMAVELADIQITSKYESETLCSG
jgi:histidine ammonia-lyase